MIEIKQEWENVLWQVQEQTNEYLTQNEKDEFQTRIAILAKELDDKNR